MQSERQKTCEERIADHLASRVQDFADFGMLTQYADSIEPARQAAADRLDIDTADLTADDLCDAAQERLYEYPLSIQTLRVHRIDISTGGPGDWLEAFVDEDGDIDRIVYHFNDWYDHAERTLEGRDFETAEMFVSALIPEL